jgi:hypothetical protein
VKSRADALLGAACLLLLAWGLWRALALAWVCDDGFVSLRYAQNLLAGHGLVYNAGERVEGYTNLLWTLLLAGLMRAGLDPLRAAELPGVAAYLWLALALAHWSFRQARDAGRPFLPLAAGFVLLSPDFQVWATGGLETSLFSALAAQALVLTRLPGAPGRRPLAAGGLLALLALTRPDGLLFAAVGVASWWLPPARFARADRLRHATATLAPVLLVLALWVPWKLAYYGELLPTAFHSKSAARPWLSQGLAYLGLYLAQNWVLAAALCAWPWLARATRGRAPAQARWDERCFLGGALLFAAWVVWVGGDFMFARRLLPAVPLALLALEGRLAQLPRPRARAALAAALLAGAALPLPLLARAGRIANVADERLFYPPETLAARRAQGRAVGAALAGTPARVAFEGGMCMFGFYSGLPYLAEITGLTQYSLAKRPLAERGAVGHEKVADAEWLTQNGIHFVVSQDLPPQRRPAQRQAVDQIYFGGLARARIHLYDDAVMDRLRGREGVDFVPIERTLEWSRQRMEGASLAEAEAIYAELRRYYLERAGPRGAPFDRALRALLEAKRAREE